MSKAIYIRCLSHTPYIRIDEQVGNNDSYLPQIRKDLANRNNLVQAWRVLDGEVDLFSRDRQRQLRFMVDHHLCSLGIVDEYGKEYSVQEEPETPKVEVRQLWQMVNGLDTVIGTVKVVGEGAHASINLHRLNPDGVAYFTQQYEEWQESAYRESHNCNLPSRGISNGTLFRCMPCGKRYVKIAGEWVRR